MRHYLYVLLAIVSCSCMNDTQNKLNNQKISFIQDFYSSPKVCVNVEIRDSIAKYYSQELSALENTLVYILNGDCSVCIGDLIDLLSLLKDANNTLPVTILTTEENIVSVQYYISRIRLNFEYEIFYQCTSKDTDCLSFYNGSVLFMNKHKIINAFSYIDFKYDPNFEY